LKANERKIVYGAIGIVLLLFAVDLMGFWNWLPGFPPTAQEQPQQVWTPTEKENYALGIGLFEMSHTCYDSLSPSTPLTHATNYNLYWYTKRGTTWVYHGTGGTVASPVYVDMTPEDSAELYVAVKIVASQNYHIDAAKIAETNSDIKETMWADIDEDTISEFVFKYDMKGHSIPNSGYPAITFKAHCYADDTSFNGVSSLANLGDIGATKVTKWMEWDSIFSATGKAVPITKIEFKVNQTDTTLVQLKQIQLPGRGFVDASNLAFSETASDYRWTYTYGTTYATAYYYTSQAGYKTTKDMDVKADFTLGSINVTCSLTMWWLDPEAGTQSSDTDDCVATYT